MAQVTIPELMGIIGQKDVEIFGLRKDISDRDQALKELQAQIQEVYDAIPEEERLKLMSESAEVQEHQDAEATGSEISG